MGRIWQVVLIVVGAIALILWQSDLRTPGQEGRAATGIVMACLAFGGVGAIGWRRRYLSASRTRAALVVAVILAGSLGLGLVMGLAPVARVQSLVVEKSVQLQGTLKGEDFLIEQYALVTSDEYLQTSVGVKVTNLGENNNRTPLLEVVLNFRGSDPVTCASTKRHVWWAGTGDTMEETLYCEEFISRADLQLIESARVTAE